MLVQTLTGRRKLFQMSVTSVWLPGGKKRVLDTNANPLISAILKCWLGDAYRTGKSGIIPKKSHSLIFSSNSACGI